MLYHGSGEEIEFPEIRKTKYTKDFSWGFYCTNLSARRGTTKARVSIASVVRRLGHASMTTTQKTYLHIIQELENKDVDLVMRTLSGL